MPDVKQNAALLEHNKARAKRGAASLTWDDSLAKDAQDWAQKLAKENIMKHAGEGIGENLSAGYPVPQNPYLSATQAWLKEESAYRGTNAQVWEQNMKNGGRPPNWMDIGHYAMLMSKETGKMGMGWAAASNGMCYVVARYDPFGQCYFKKEYL